MLAYAGKYIAEKGISLRKQALDPLKEILTQILYMSQIQIIFLSVFSHYLTSIYLLLHVLDSQNCNDIMITLSLSTQLKTSRPTSKITFLGISFTFNFFVSNMSTSNIIMSTGNLFMSTGT